MDENKENEKKAGKKNDIVRMLSLKSTAIRVAFFSAIVAIAAFIFAAVLLVYLIKSGSENDRLRADADRDAAQAAVRLSEANEKSRRAEDAAAVMQSELDAVKTELEEKKTELEALRASGQEAHEEEISALKTQIETLEAQITAMENGAPLRLEGLTECLDKLGTLLRDEVPTQTAVVESVDEYGYKVYENQTVQTAVAFAVVDPTRNVVYSHNGSAVFPSAGLKPLAYALALLRTAEAEEARPEDMQNKTVDLDEKYVFSSADVVPGAGILKNAQEGDEYTYFDLVNASLQYADATAHAVLEKKFGGEILSSFLSSLGTTVMKESADSVTLSDALLLFRELNRYFRTGTKYAAAMRTAMSSAVSTELSSVTALPVAKRYGRGDGANHDMGIVLGDEPIIVIFLSDAKERSEEFSAYVASVEKAGLSLVGACR